MQRDWPSKDSGGAEPVLNLTTILSLLDSYTELERQALFNKLGVSDIGEFFNFLDTDQSQEMSVKNYEKQLMQYDEYWYHKQLLLYVPPIIFIIGTIGNILSCVILSRNPMARVSTYLYLAVLSITDTLVLLIGLLRKWIGEVTGYDIIDHSDWSCKTLSVIAYTVSDYSVWLIIAVTVERYIAICWPLRAPSMCNKRRALIVIITILLLLLCINLHFLWTTEVRYSPYKNESIPQCDGGDNYQRLVVEIWPWVDAFLYSFVPVVVISILNGLIIQKVIQARKDRTQLSTSCSSNRGADGRRHHVESSAKLTIMLLTISFFFLITTLPVNIAMIVTAFLQAKVRNLKEYSKFILARTIVDLLMYINHSMNFFLYCATGQKFREQLKVIICRRPANPTAYFTYHSHASPNGVNNTRPCNGTRMKELKGNPENPMFSNAQCSLKNKITYQKVKSEDEESPAL